MVASGLHPLWVGFFVLGCWSISGVIILLSTAATSSWSSSTACWLRSVLLGAVWDALHPWVAGRPSHVDWVVTEVEACFLRIFMTGQHVAVQDPFGQFNTVTFWCNKCVAPTSVRHQHVTVLDWPKGLCTATCSTVRSLARIEGRRCVLLHWKLVLCTCATSAG